MRMFVAFTPPAEAAADLADFLAPRRTAVRDLRWVDVEQWHVTLAFLADLPERKLDELVERLVRAAARRQPFDIALRGGGAFPDVARGCVLFAGLEVGSTGVELERLAAGARAAASKAGGAVDGASFHPHLTLARTGRPRELTNLVRVLDTYAGPTWQVDDLQLFASHLGEGPRGAPRHELLAALPLGVAGGDVA